VALDGAGRNSPFAGALAKRIASSSDDLSALLIDVRNDVRKETQNKQIPWEHSALTGRFYFNPSTQAESRPLASPNSPGLNGLRDAAEAWDRTKETTSIPALEAFLTRFKETYYADLARLRIDELMKKQQVAVAPQPEVAAQPLSASVKRNDDPSCGRFRAQTACASDPTCEWVPIYGYCRKTEVVVAVAPAPAPAKRAEPAPTDTAVATQAVPPQLAKTTEAQTPARCDGIEVQVENDRRCLKPGSGKTEWFKDCPGCPEMVVVPAGQFMMGSPGSEAQREDAELQVHVAIPRPFAVARYAVTRGEFASFMRSSAHKIEGDCLVAVSWEANAWKPGPGVSWRSPGFEQNDRHPVVCVNWEDAKAFAAWVSKKTGMAYRLLSESEREYVARAGTSTPFWWGASISPDQANYQASLLPYRGGGATGEFRKATVAVDSFGLNPWGLFQVHGNVYEWTEDCWNETNHGNPANGQARTTGDCSRRVRRGGSWINYPQFLRAAIRRSDRLTARAYNFGFRLARTLD
jgi:formylglycine-generating enzyme required for sulfatase activity